MQRTVREIPLEQALSEGFIRDEVKGLVGERPLHMIEVGKDGSVIVRQLWARGLAWWVYEESEFRKSWLLKISIENEQLSMSNEQ